MEEDLQSLGEELISTAARIVRWAPRDAQGFTVSLAAARLLLGCWTTADPDQ
jgi:hypothetical protein